MFLDGHLECSSRLDGGSSLVALTGLWPLLSPLAGQKRPPILPGGRISFVRPEGSIIPGDCRRRRLIPNLTEIREYRRKRRTGRALRFAGTSPLCARGFEAHAGVKSIDRYAAVPLGQPHCSFAFARAGLRRTPRPSASNSIPALSSAAWIARSVEPRVRTILDVIHRRCRDTGLRCKLRLGQTGHRASGADLVNRDHGAVLRM
jgi:hypothetical protein